LETFDFEFSVKILTLLLQELILRPYKSDFVRLSRATFATIQERSAFQERFCPPFKSEFRPKEKIFDYHIVVRKSVFHILLHKKIQKSDL